MRVFGRYLLFQAAGWGLGALVLGGLVYWDVVSLWLAGVLLAALLAKDLILFPYVRDAYESGAPHGGGALLGAVARVERWAGSEGWIRVGAESWRARVGDGSVSLAAGEFVEIREIEDLVLIVAPVAPARIPESVQVAGATVGRRDS
jgi:membrane protein implicated in regulation of membrane protease activity